MVFFIVSDPKQNFHCFLEKLQSSTMVSSSSQKRIVPLARKWKQTFQGCVQEPIMDTCKQNISEKRVMIPFSLSDNIHAFKVLYQMLLTLLANC
jgi:hypothetical protein